MTAIEGKEYKYRYRVTDNELQYLNTSQWNLEVNKIHELVNIWRKPNLSPEEEEIIGSKVELCIFHSLYLGCL